MTVKELIEDLSKYDNDYEVVVDTISDGVVCVVQETFKHDNLIYLTGFGSDLKNKIK